MQTQMRAPEPFSPCRMPEVAQQGAMRRAPAGARRKLSKAPAGPVSRGLKDSEMQPFRGAQNLLRNIAGHNRALAAAPPVFCRPLAAAALSSGLLRNHQFRCRRSLTDSFDVGRRF